jgi:ATP-dependent DNA helicase RecQ
VEEMQNIPGVGAGKANKPYVQDFIALIKKHVHENEIERPEDLRVKTVANKSKLKVEIIQAIDRKISLEDIAISKGLEFAELIDEIDAIVNSGTKINIDYFIEDEIDLDKVDEIMDYFSESADGDIDEAINELGPDFTEEEIRLVRIKYISENSN